MKKFFNGLLLLATMAITGQSANAIGWPGSYEGVMLQGFYWDSYQTETQWTKLEARADELSKSFDLIWVPNSGKSTGGLGYIPIYWFTNHNSDMGSEAQLRSMIATYKAKVTPGDITVYWDNSTTNWAIPHIHYWGGAESKWPGVAMSNVGGNIWTYTCPAGTTGCLFNAGNGDATKTSDFKAIDGHVYTRSGDQGPYTVSHPEKLYLVGHVNGTAWSTTATDAIAGNKTADGVFGWPSVEVNECGDGNGYISFITRTGSDWDTEVNQGDRYGAASKDAVLTEGTATIKKFTANIDASSAYSWRVPAAQYTINADLPNSMITISKIGTTVEYILGEANKDAEFYNLQGIRIDTPVPGHIYIMRRGDTVAKVLY